MFLTKPALVAVGDPIVFTFLKNLVAVLVFFGTLFFFSGGLSLWRNTSPSDRRRLFLVGVIGGGVPFVLFFSGLALIPAVTAAFIHKTLFVWVALLAVPFLGEKINRSFAVALVFLLLGVLLFQVPSLHSFGKGEVLVLAATLLWAVEHILAKKLLDRVPVVLAASARMGIGSLIIFLFVLFEGKAAVALTLAPVAWAWVLGTGLLLTGYVSLWYRALSLAPASFVSCLLVPASFITGMLSSVFVTHTVSGQQVFAWALLLVGIAFLPVGAFFVPPSKALLTPTIS